jgi:hypothetical protein
MTRIGSTRFVLLAALSVLLLAANSVAQFPPEVGNAVLLATNSIQVDRECVVSSGDLIVNAASTTTILGEKDLSLDPNVTTAAGFALKANSVDIDSGAVVGGAVYYNVLDNGGTINGGLFTPLALPVFSSLPAMVDGTAGATNVSIGNNQTQTVAAGSYGSLTVGRNATVRFSGGTYVFASIAVDRDSSVTFDAAADVVVKGLMTLGQNATVGGGSGVTTKRKMFYVHGIDGVVIGRDSHVGATIDAPNGAITIGQGTQVTGSLLARDIRFNRSCTLTLRSGFRNIAPVANSQTVAGSGPLTITLTGFDADGDPLTFSIVTAPAHGTLSSITPTGPMSATVVYTPDGSNPDDAFIFRVTDSEGASGQAAVLINDGRAPPAPTVVVNDASGDALKNIASTLTLAGDAPSGVALTFSIISSPSHGTLGAVTSSTDTSASVTYTPATDYTGSDSFQFQACGVISGNTVCDSATFSVNVVPVSVVANDASAEVLKNTAMDIVLTGSSQPATALTFSIVSGGGPSHGTLGAVTSTTDTSASVTYTPATDYTGLDSFQFQACGVISSNTVCDTATMSINVAARTGSEPADIAPDIQATTFAGEELTIELPQGTTSSGMRFVIRPLAAVAFGAAVAGNVADSNTDGFGDNHNALPGSTPVLMSAGVGQSGGAGSNGTVRMEFEWDITNYNSLADSLVSASVLLHTNRGTSDSADTFFHWIGADNDGLLTDSDYERTAEVIGDAVMPVPSSQLVGEDGTFSIDVLAEVRAAMRAGNTHFSIQGRVNETQAGPVRGLQVYTTADGNLTAGREPSLGLATPGVAARSYHVLSLPSLGTLKDGNGASITSVPYLLPSPIVVYNPPVSSAGTTNFNYQVTEGSLVNTGTIYVTIVLGDCRTDTRFCNDGRQ